MLDRAVSARPRRPSERDGDNLLANDSQARRPHSGNRPKRPRIPSRLGAPVALAAAVLAIVVVVSTHHHGAAKSSHPATVAPPHSRHHFWIVRPNQTLSEIVSRTGVSLTRIEQLNPRLNPGALQTGQLIRIRP